MGVSDFSERGFCHMGGQEVNLASLFSAFVCFKKKPKNLLVAVSSRH